MEESPALTTLTERERVSAFARYHVLRPFLEDGIPLGSLGKQHGIAVRTAQRWLAKYRRYGLAELARKARADRGQRRRVEHRLGTWDGAT